MTRVDVIHLRCLAAGAVVGAVCVLLAPVADAQTLPPVSLEHDAMRVTAEVADAQTLPQLECGDGTSFTVPLPARDGIADSLELPNGCRIYALFVSGYSRNPSLDELTFYNAAKFVMEHDGYVHWAWWNNVLKPYLGGPVRPGLTFTNPVTGVVHPPTPGGVTAGAGFVPLAHEFDVQPKAVPEDDFHFQADARLLLRAIRQHNPDAIIVVAGHSMGGNAVARLGTARDVDIDLLAPIDPVGNRSSPVGRPTAADPRPDRTYNWTRWRATREFRGFRMRDCVRNAVGLCQNFGTVFRPDYRCRNLDPLLTAPPPLPGSLAPLICPGPWVDSGVRLQFGGNVKRLYHRWQNEAIFPFDYQTHEIYLHHAPRSQASVTGSRNYQAPVVTCAAGADPRDPRRACSASDGHAEIVGMRTQTEGQPNPPGPNVPVAPIGVQALAWPTTAAGRREKLLEMRHADDNWGHRPLDPSLCLVSDDLVAVIGHLLSEQTVPVGPTTTATPVPAPNDHGWHHEDVLVQLTATTDAGRTITGIEYATSGAQWQGATIADGNAVEVTIVEEGDTIITFFARDDGGGVEPAQSITIRLDKTPPTIVSTVDPAPNEHGWHRSDVTVSFVADDALSGVDSVSEPVTVVEEGAGHEVVGIATDLAGNTSAVVVTVDLDRTPPVLTGLPSDGCVLWPPNGQLVHVASIGATDALSGIAGSAVVAATSDEPADARGAGRPGLDDVVIDEGQVWLRARRAGGGDGRTYAIEAVVRDRADNVTTGTAVCTVPHDQRRR